MEIIRAAHLNKRFTNVDNPIIRELNLTIIEGEFVAIMGSSGSGKSTLLYLLSGLDKADSGEIYLNDFAVHALGEKKLSQFRRKNVGFVFQDHNLVPNLSILENLMVPAYLLDSDGKKNREKSLELLTSLGIGELAHRLPSQVSGGQRQRAAIARALVNKPSILLADEPTGSLNSGAAEAILDSFSMLHKAGQSILLVTHDLQTACRAQKVLFMSNGQLLESLDHPTEEKLLPWLKQKNW